MRSLATPSVAAALACGLAFALVALPASADGGSPDAKEPSAAPAKKPAAKAPSEPVFDPDNKTAISKYNDTIVRGNGKYLARDFAGALDLYKSAVPLAPKNPLGHYVIAEARIAEGNLPEAEASLAQAEANSDERTAALRAKILFLQADVKERQKRWDEAKAAWTAYGEFAQKHAGLGFQPTAASRIQAIDDMVKQEKAYVAVRERIAAERASSTNPATPKK